MKNLVYIYSLCCPLTGVVRYVGKAEDPAQRFKRHLRNLHGKNHKANWIRSLADAGLKPALGILDEVPETEWQALEAAYIQFFREEGFDLTNSTDGGDGRSGDSPSPETRAKLSAARLGKKLSPEWRTKISAAKFGKEKSPETRAKMSASMLGKPKKPRSPEHCAKMSASMRVVWAVRRGQTL